jgi:hypothetical protein
LGDNLNLIRSRLGIPRRFNQDATCSRANFGAQYNVFQRTASSDRAKRATLAAAFSLERLKQQVADSSSHLLTTVSALIVESRSLRRKLVHHPGMHV